MSGIVLPDWLQWFFIVILAVFSGLFSGLNLGLMGLDPVGLEIVMSGGEPNKSYAQKIKPLREHGNWLLCTLLLGNVAVNAALSILLSAYTNGVVGFLLSTGIIVVFGEIVPQAFCSRYALWIGARTVYIVWPLMWLMAVIAYPIAWLLDRVLGDELGTIYSNKELQKLVDIHAQLEETGLNQRTANMLKGALGLQEKQVKDVMTVFTEVFWLNADAKLTFDVLVEIFKSGHSRIPIISIDKFNRTTVEGILYVKDLILLDPDDEMPVSQIMNAFRHKRPPTLWLDSTLDTALRTFLKENQHLAIVQSITDRQDHLSALNLKQPSNPNLVAPFPDSNGNIIGNGNILSDRDNSRNNNIPPEQLGGDRIYEFIGIITLEDVIEHVLQTQLVDEHDNFIDTHHNQKTGRLDNFEWALLHMFDHRHRVLTNLPPQELQAVYHFLCQSVRSFAPGTARMSEASIKNLLASSAVIRVNLSMHQTQNQATNSHYANSNVANMNRLGLPDDSGPSLGISGKLHSSSSLNAKNNNNNNNNVGDGSQWNGQGGATRRLGYGSGAVAVAKGHITQRDPYKDIENNGLLLYQRDVKTDYFSLLLDGKCEVIAGKQGFRCELSRWSYLCPDALEHVEECVINSKPTLDYVADFTCKVIENSRVLRIKLSDFRACLEGKYEPHNVSLDPWTERPHSSPMMTNNQTELHRLIPKTSTLPMEQNSSGNYNDNNGVSTPNDTNQNSQYLMSNQRNPSSSSLSSHLVGRRGNSASRNYAEKMTGRGLPRSDTNTTTTVNTDIIDSKISDVEINMSGANSDGAQRKHIYTNRKNRSRLGTTNSSGQAHSTIHEASVERSRDSPFADEVPPPYIATSSSQRNIVTEKDSNLLLPDHQQTSSLGGLETTES